MTTLECNGVHDFIKPFDDSDSKLIEVYAEDGRTAYLKIVDGKMALGGDLPADDAAKRFFEVCGEQIIGAIKRS